MSIERLHDIKPFLVMDVLDKADGMERNGEEIISTGAIYVFANAKKFSLDSLRFAMDILKHAKLATAPGIDFGKNGEGFLRFSYAVSVDKIREGMARLDRHLRHYCGLT